MPIFRGLQLILMLPSPNHSMACRAPASSPLPATASSADYTGPCLLFFLQPVRQCLQPYLNARDAMSLMQSSRSITTALLTGHATLDHDHALSYGKRSTAAVKRSIALFAQYHMRILAMSLPREWNEPLVDAESGQPVLPSSLLARALGAAAENNNNNSVLNALSDGEKHCKRWRKKEEERMRRVGEESEEEFHSLMETVSCTTDATAWTVHCYGEVSARLNRPVPLAALPHGLRFLQFSREHNQPLQHGSIPDTVEVLQFGVHFNQPLADLRRLYLGLDYNHPLQLGLLPPQLQELHIGGCFNLLIPPGVIPSSVTHLRLSVFFNQPLQMQHC